MIQAGELEEMFRYFQPKPETGTALPDIKSVRDWTLFVVDTGAVQTLYIAFKGAWKTIGTI